MVQTEFQKPMFSSSLFPTAKIPFTIIRYFIESLLGTKSLKNTEVPKRYKCSFGKSPKCGSIRYWLLILLGPSYCWDSRGYQQFSSMPLKLKLETSEAMGKGHSDHSRVKLLQLFYKTICQHVLSNKKKCISFDIASPASVQEYASKC